jgi:hypothetical protein
MFNVDKRAISCVSCAFDGEIPVFVFGSNLAGRHGRGAAIFAKDHRGALLGAGIGYHGNSYAIPTKDGALRPLPLEQIGRHVHNFIQFALAREEKTFQVTPIGCGLAGYSPRDIAPFFRDAPANCILPFEFIGLVQ